MRIHKGQIQQLVVFDAIWGVMRIHKGEIQQLVVFDAILHLVLDVFLASFNVRVT